MGRRSQRRYPNHYFLSPIIACSNPNFDSAVDMLIDTGATRTSISYTDALKLNIDITGLLYGGRFQGIGGFCDFYLTRRRAELAFEISKDIYHVRRLKSLAIMKPQLETDCCPKCNNEWTPESKRCPECDHEWAPNNEETRESVLKIPSILGMDILKRYNIRFTKELVYLEY